MGDIKGTNKKSNFEILREGIDSLKQDLEKLNKDTVDYAQQVEKIEAQILHQEVLIAKELLNNNPLKPANLETDIDAQAAKIKAELQKCRESLKSLKRDAADYVQSAEAIKNKMYTLIPVVSALSATHKADMEMYQQEIEAEWDVEDARAKVLADEALTNQQGTENQLLQLLEQERLRNLAEENDRREKQLAEENDKREKQLAEDNEKRLKKLAEVQEKEQKKRAEEEEKRKQKLADDQAKLELKVKLYEEKERLTLQEEAKNEDFERLTKECLKNVKIIFESQDILGQRLSTDDSDDVGTIESLQLRDHAIKLFDHDISQLKGIGVDFPYNGIDLLDPEQVNISNIVIVLNNTEKKAHEPQNDVVLLNNAQRTNNFMLGIATILFGVPAIQAETKHKLEVALQEAIVKKDVGEIERLKKDLGLDPNNNNSNNNHSSANDSKYKSNRALGRLYLKCALIGLGVSLICVSIAIAAAAPVAVPFAIGGCKYGLSLLLAGLSLGAAGFMHYQDNKQTKRPNTFSYNKVKQTEGNMDKNINLQSDGHKFKKVVKKKQ